jgi:hypothetical protein
MVNFNYAFLRDDCWNLKHKRKQNYIWQNKTYKMQGKTFLDGHHNNEDKRNEKQNPH